MIVTEGLDPSTAQNMGNWYSRDADVLAHKKVEYLHRTVEDWLCSDDIWKRISSAAPELSTPRYRWDDLAASGDDWAELKRRHFRKTKSTLRRLRTPRLLFGRIPPEPTKSDSQRLVFSLASQIPNLSTTAIKNYPMTDDHEDLTYLNGNKASFDINMFDDYSPESSHFGNVLSFDNHTPVPSHASLRSQPSFSS
ncbi:hypothetical protein QQS21_005949 [Conoideocrella luteorostrata]|uniref:Uncharacterized protein n=1 Tax=Conoideocrella luteorostrata TaxID=1105319 RepID=A0AAJ0FYQ1_9HYPO|nr:hypothetical protein QQS21_005949 [Conoideocrella luteorostrata]